jgi:membrane glycosyltransferase
LNFAALRTSPSRPAAAAPLTPPLKRTPMAPTAPVFRGARGDAATQSPDPVGHWQLAGTLRRTLLFSLVAGQTALAAYFMSGVLPYQGSGPLEIAILVLFTLLFAWVSAGFWTALAGFAVLVFGDVHAISRSAAGGQPIDRAARTALIMPICNESVPRVFAGLRATLQSLQETGELERFDCFVLSDSADPDARVAEMRAWRALRDELDLPGQLFYRWRRYRARKKAGNVADFCRRWGAHYRYVVVLDADSVMSGQCLTTLVRLMEANPNAGIIQTAPRAAGRDTFYARMQQFAGRVYGPLFTAGLHYWQLGEAHYWGHNAILRVAPFMRHCALGELPGRGPLSGEILSHDFVEAALMRRAGWAVWIAYDLEGSYEEMPPNLLDELKRDRRWCHGNLINARLLLGRGFHSAHRAVFVTGVMAYLSAPLWFLFLVLSTALLAQHVLVPPTYFVEPRQLFPVWPQWNLQWAIGLLSATALLLFLPKLLAVALLCARGAREYGGRLRLAASALAEVVFSALLAPVRMLFHSYFVLVALTGLKAQWKSPSREDSQTGWAEALRRHGIHGALGLAWAALVYALEPSFLWWLLPVVGALIVSPAVSVLTSGADAGRRLRQAGLFLIPEEAAPPPELASVAAAARQAQRLPGFVEAVVDAQLNTALCALARVRPKLPPALRAEREALARRACRSGPQSLSTRERSMFLSDGYALAQLHRAVWNAPVVHGAWHHGASTMLRLRRGTSKTGAEFTPVRPATSF